MSRIISDPPSTRKPRALDPPPHFDTLPVALDSPLRTYNSAITGLYLTHPGGWLEGGFPTDAEVNSFEQRYVEEFQRTQPKSTTTVLKRRIKDDIARAREELEERMRERSDALEENKKLDEEISRLEMERSMERKVEEKMRAQYEEKRSG